MDKFILKIILWTPVIDISRHMLYAGNKVYNECTYVDRLKEIPEIFVYGKAEVSVVGFGSDKFNIYRLSDALALKGWNLNALQFPSRFVGKIFPLGL